MCSQSEALEILEQVYEAAKHIIPIQDAYLYGSYARGDFRDDSDIDIFLTSLVSPEETEAHRWDMVKIASRLSLDHDVEVSVCVRPATSFQPEKNFYYANIAREGIRLNQEVSP